MDKTAMQRLNDKFTPEFFERYKYDSTFIMIARYLNDGVDPYKIIEYLIMQREELIIKMRKLDEERAALTLHNLTKDL